MFVTVRILPRDLPEDRSRTPAGTSVTKREYV
jgi:hypothetical protein